METRIKSFWKSISGRGSSPHWCNTTATAVDGTAKCDRGRHNDHPAMVGTWTLWVPDSPWMKPSLKSAPNNADRKNIRQLGNYVDLATFEMLKRSVLIHFSWYLCSFLRNPGGTAFRLNQRYGTKAMIIFSFVEKLLPTLPPITVAFWFPPSK